MKIKLQDIQHALACDTISRKSGVITVRWGFYYTHGRDENTYLARVLNAFPGASIADSGQVWKAFRGGASIANQSHFWVKFEMPVVVEPTIENACC